MRRGTSATATPEATQRRRPPFDLDQLEGGNSAGPSSLHGQSFHSQSSSMDSLDIMGASALSSNGDSPMMIYDDSQGKTKHRHYHRYKHGSLGISQVVAGLSQTATRSPAIMAAIIIGSLVLFLLIPSVEWTILAMVYATIGFGGLVSQWLYVKSVLDCDDGSSEMRAVADPIRQGATGFLQVQYSAITKFAVPLSILIVLSYQVRPTNSHATGVALLGNGVLGLVAALGFVFGAASSAVAGYVSMWVAAQSNVSVASASRRTYAEALVVCFRGGAFSAVLNLTLCVAGVTLLFTILRLVFASAGGQVDLGSRSPIHFQCEITPTNVASYLSYKTLRRIMRRPLHYHRPSRLVARTVS